MKNSRDRIIVTHVGSLPRPDALIEANAAREAGKGDEAAFQKILRDSVADVVRKQKELGIDIPNDGEYGKSMGQRVNYRAWSYYAFDRLGGLEPDTEAGWKTAVTTRPAEGELVLKGMNERRDRVAFSQAYFDPEGGISMGPDALTTVRPVCTGPITYTGQDAVAADIANFKAALAANGYDEGFMTAVGPASVSRILNKYYKTDEELMFAVADAMAVEFKAIVDAGLILQIDDPAITDNWDSIDPEPPLDDYLKFTMRRVEALNRATKGLPKDRIRFHLCWGSWHGPHTTDIPMKDIIGTMLAIEADAYTFEAANARHEHEWSVWKKTKLPKGKLVIPGIVSHATNVVEHPDLVAERICRFAEVVGKENVIASTDCGLGGRIHPQIAWAKLEALSEGARRASKKLWG